MLNKYQLIDCDGAVHASVTSDAQLEVFSQLKYKDKAIRHLVYNDCGVLVLIDGISPEQFVQVLDVDNECTDTQSMQDLLSEIGIEFVREYEYNEKELFYAAAFAEINAQSAAASQIEVQCGMHTRGFVDQAHPPGQIQ